MPPKAAPTRTNLLVRGSVMIAAFVAAGLFIRALEGGQFLNAEWVDATIRDHGLTGQIVFLAVGPALRDGSLMRATIAGAVLGLVAYATYDLTNQATLRVWPLHVTLIDVAWGTLLTATAAAAGCWLGRGPADPSRPWDRSPAEGRGIAPGGRASGRDPRRTRGAQQRFQRDWRESPDVDADVGLPGEGLQPAVAVPMQVQRPPVLSIPAAEGVVAQDKEATLPLDLRIRLNAFPAVRCIRRRVVVAHDEMLAPVQLRQEACREAGRAGEVAEVPDLVPG